MKIYKVPQTVQLQVHWLVYQACIKWDFKAMWTVKDTGIIESYGFIIEIKEVLTYVYTKNNLWKIKVYCKKRLNRKTAAHTNTQRYPSSSSSDVYDYTPCIKYDNKAEAIRSQLKSKHLNKELISKRARIQYLLYVILLWHFFRPLNSYISKPFDKRNGLICGFSLFSKWYIFFFVHKDFPV